MGNVSEVHRSGQLMIFTGTGQPFQRDFRRVRDLKEGEVLVRNKYTAICGSDLHTYAGLRKELCPTVLGHEVVGEVVEIESSHESVDYKGSPLSVGDLVTWTIFCSEPHSHNALKGIPQKGDGLFKYGHALVEGKENFHGGLAEFCILKKNTCIIKLPVGLPDKVAAIINCTVATAAGSLRLAGSLKGKTVAIFGMGALGITCAAMCRDSGAGRIYVADIDKDRSTRALNFGADETIDLPEYNSASGCSDTGSFLPKADVVFDMSGSPNAMELGISMLKIGGAALWVGAVYRSRNLSIDAEFIVRNMITIKGLHNYNYEDFCKAADFITRAWKRYPFESIIEKEFRLGEAQEAFDYALTQKPLRVGIRMG